MSEAQYVRGLYSMWDQVLAARPGLLIDTCASGGRRIDLEILQRAVALWFTDYGFTVPADHCPQPEIDALVTENDWSGQQALSMGAYLTMPLTSVGTHIFHYEPYRFRSGGPASRTIDWGQTAWQGIVKNSSKFSMLKAALEEQRMLRQFAESDNDFWPLTEIGVDETAWAAYQVVRKAQGDGFAMFFRRCRAANSTLTVQLNGLSPTRQYRLEYRHGYSVDKSETKPGASLSHGFTVELAQRSSSVLVLISAADETSQLKADDEDAPLLHCGPSQNCTNILQAAIDGAVSTGGIVSLAPGVWTVVQITLRSNLRLQLAAGTTLMAQAGAFHDGAAHILSCEGLTNVTVRGAVGGGSRLVMRKADYINTSLYTHSEGRHAVELMECTHIVLSDLHISDTGGKPNADFRPRKFA